MSARPKALMSWSTGKDAAYALHVARQLGELEIVGLLTTVTGTFGRVSMHGTREALLDLQAAALGLPCWKVYIPAPCPNEVYERNLKVMLDRAAQQGLSHVVFGDLALQDVRRYREAQLAVWCTLLVGAPAAGAPVWRVVGAADGCPATHAIAAALARLLPAGRVTEDPEEAAPILVRVEDHGRSNRG